MGYLNGLFVLARSIGLIGELLFDTGCCNTGESSASAGHVPPRLPFLCHPPRTRLGCLSANLVASSVRFGLSLPLQAMRWTRSACSSRCSGTHGTKCCTPSEQVK